MNRTRIATISVLVLLLCLVAAQSVISTTADYTIDGDTVYIDDHP